MSINPVQSSEPSASPAAKSYSRPAPASPSHPSENANKAPDLGTGAKPAAHLAQDTSETREMPQDEVQVQRDNEANGEIVIKYLDGHGEVILQIPSSEVLQFVRSIRQDLESAGRAPAREQAGPPESRRTR